MSVRIPVRITPRSPANVVTGFKDGVLQVRVTAAPERGRANEALVRLIAAGLGIARSRVSIAAGAASRNKLIVVEGCSEAEIAAAFGDRSAGGRGPGDA